MITTFPLLMLDTAYTDDYVRMSTDLGQWGYRLHPPIIQFQHLLNCVHRLLPAKMSEIRSSSYGHRMPGGRIL